VAGKVVPIKMLIRENKLPFSKEYKFIYINLLY
jgi:hypothetical protein